MGAFLKKMLLGVLCVVPTSIFYSRILSFRYVQLKKGDQMVHHAI
jgi:hypothetical protein